MAKNHKKLNVAGKIMLACKLAQRYGVTNNPVTNPLTVIKHVLQNSDCQPR